MTSRYRLIPTLGRHPSRMFEGGELDAISEAAAIAAGLECQVLVCAAPVGGIVRRVALVGDPPPKPKKAAR